MLRTEAEALAASPAKSEHTQRRKVITAEQVSASQNCPHDDNSLQKAWITADTCKPAVFLQVSHQGLTTTKANM